MCLQLIVHVMDLIHGKHVILYIRIINTTHTLLCISYISYISYLLHVFDKQCTLCYPTLHCISPYRDEAISFRSTLVVLGQALLPFPELDPLVLVRPFPGSFQCLALAGSLQQSHPPLPERVPLPEVRFVADDKEGDGQTAFSLRVGGGAEGAESSHLIGPLLSRVPGLATGEVVHEDDTWQCRDPGGVGLGTCGNRDTDRCRFVQCSRECSTFV